MRNARRHAIGATITAALLLAVSPGCGGSDGKAPRISDMTYSPMAIPAGEDAEITGSFSFEDPDGDVLELLITIRGPDGTETELTPSMLTGLEEVMSGGVNFTLTLRLGTPGTYELDVRVRDANGNDSNALTGTLEVS